MQQEDSRNSLLNFAPRSTGSLPNDRYDDESPKNTNNVFSAQVSNKDIEVDINSKPLQPLVNTTKQETQEVLPEKKPVSISTTRYSLNNANNVTNTKTAETKPNTTINIAKIPEGKPVDTKIANSANNRPAEAKNVSSSTTTNKLITDELNKLADAITEEMIKRLLEIEVRNPETLVPIKCAIHLPITNNNQNDSMSIIIIFNSFIF